MALLIQFTFLEGTTLESIVMDATLKESHDLTAEISEFPVEVGSDVNDNIRKKPDGLQVECIVSDFPLSNDGRSQVSSGAPAGFSRPVAAKGRSNDVLEKLNQLMEEGRTVNVFTGLRQYRNMGVAAVRVNRDKSIKNGLALSLTLKALNIVKSQTATVQRVEPKAKSSVKGGPKTSTQASEAQTDKAGSIITQLADKLVKRFQ